MLFVLFLFSVNELILKQKQRFEEKRFKLDHSVSSTVCFNSFITIFNTFHFALFIGLILIGYASLAYYCFFLKEI